MNKRILVTDGPPLTADEARWVQECLLLDRLIVCGRDDVEDLTARRQLVAARLRCSRRRTWSAWRRSDSEDQP